MCKLCAAYPRWCSIHDLFYQAEKQSKSIRRARGIYLELRWVQRWGGCAPLQLHLHQCQGHRRILSTVVLGLLLGGADGR